MKIVLIIYATITFLSSIAWSIQYYLEKRRKDFLDDIVIPFAQYTLAAILFPLWLPGFVIDFFVTRKNKKKQIIRDMLR